jgi:hypothetical protein
MITPMWKTTLKNLEYVNLYFTATPQWFFLEVQWFHVVSVHNQGLKPGG